MKRKKVYLFIQAALYVLLVIMLSTAAIRIFREGSERRAADPLESIYSAQAVAEQFKYIAPVLFAAVGMTAAGLILGACDDKDGRRVRDIRSQRDLISERVTGQSKDVNAARSFQRRARAGGWTAFAICMVPAAVYLLNGAHFQDMNLENMIAALVCATGPWVCAGIACLMIAGVLEEKGIRREIDALKAQLAAGKESEDGTAGGRAVPEGSGSSDAVSRKTVILQGAVIAAAIFFIAAGILNGSMHDVLIKAINICTECIGLG